MCMLSSKMLRDYSDVCKLMSMYGQHVELNTDGSCNVALKASFEQNVSHVLVTVPISKRVI